MNAQVTYVAYLSFDLSICLSFDLSCFENYISQNLSIYLSFDLSMFQNSGPESPDIVVVKQPIVTTAHTGYTPPMQPLVLLSPLPQLIRSLQIMIVYITGRTCDIQSRRSLLH